MLASVDADFPAFDVQWLVQWDRLEVFHRHLFGQGYDVAEFVDLAHGVVENRGDDASMTVAGRAGVASAEIEVADEDVAIFIEREDKMHSVGVVGAAHEAGVGGKLEVFGFVAMGLAEHGGILS